VPTPAGGDGVVDVEALYNVKGTDRVFVVTGNGHAFSRRFAPQRASWLPLPSADEPYQRIAAVEQANGRVRVFLLTASGRVLTTAEVPTRGGGLAWQIPQPFSDSTTLPPLVDIDAAWVADGPRIRLFAVDEEGGLWTREMKTTSINDGWHDWAPWVTFLAAPQVSAVGSPPPENIVSLTANHWREAGSTELQPVVFATDSHGNIYYATERQLCRADGTCLLFWSWLSFYHY